MPFCYNAAVFVKAGEALQSVACFFGKAGGAFRLSCLAAIVFLFIFPSISWANAEDIYKKNNGAVGVVTARDPEGRDIGWGSAFLVGKGGAVVTVYSVISRASSASFRIGEETRTVEGFLKIDKKTNIAVLKIADGNFDGISPAGAGVPEEGSRLYILSSPQGGANTVSVGNLKGDIEPFPGASFLMISTPSSEGSYGGAVFDRKGRAIGAVSMVLDGNLCLAVPMVSVMEGLEGVKPAPLAGRQTEEYLKTYEYWLLQGGVYWSLGMENETVTAMSEAVKANPECFDCFYKLGLAWRALGAFESSAGALKEAARLKPDDSEVFTNLGFAYGNLEMFGDAVGALRKAVSLNPNNVGARIYLGMAYDEMGLYRESVESYEEAIRLDPKNLQAYTNLAIVYGNMGKNKEAIKALKEASKISPEDPLVQYNLGVAYLIANDKNSALKVYNSLKKLDPRLAEELFNLIGK